jgi:hypothetical protein
MSEPLVLALRCPRCGGGLAGLPHDVVFWCGGCAMPLEAVRGQLIERQGRTAQAVLDLPGTRRYLPVWAVRVQIASSWEDPEREASARQLPLAEWVYVTAFDLHNPSYFGDPGLIFTQKRLQFEPAEPVSARGCSRSLEEAKAFVEPHLLTIIDRRVDVTGLTLSAAVEDVVLWGVPFADQGAILQDCIVGLKYPAGALNDLGALRAAQEP